LITGGLGPTRDDITKETLADYFDTQLVMDEAVLLNALHNWFAGRGFEMLEVNRHQAMLPGGVRGSDQSKGNSHGNVVRT
jgi:nicotinamide-nucleotide amidase